MARNLVFGNGSIIIGLDEFCRIRNFCYPFVGKEDHVKGHHHRIGIWVDGQMSWLDHNQGWEGSPKYQKESLVGDTLFLNNSIGLEISFIDCIHHKKNIYLKKIIIKNTLNKRRKIKFFQNQHFHIAGDNVGDTSYYDPYDHTIISYKGHRYFLINGRHDEMVFSQYANGAADEGDKMGTYIDAQDGTLSQNPIEHGSVDSTIGFEFEIKESSFETLYYWICVGRDNEEVKDLNQYVLNNTPERLINQTSKFWKRWVNRNKFNFSGLDNSIIDLFKRSLLIVRTLTNNNGAIIAAIDSDIMNFKLDTYNYVWPRDGALISRSLDKAGYTELTDNFFKFCANLLSKEGYLYHKYLPDKSLGSSWHPWITNGKIQLPIQEDETALVLDALWKKYRKYKDKRFVKSIYNSFIKKSGDFLQTYIDKTNYLPKPSYDLWEEKLGIHTFTCATVYSGLISAHNFAKEFKKEKDAKKYLITASKLKRSILKNLYDSETGIFLKRLYYDKSNKLQKDKTIDISTSYGLFEYGVLDIDDPLMEKTMNQTISELFNKTPIGGALRYQNDSYFKTKNSNGNPWFISSFWIAEYYIQKAKNLEDLKPVVDIFNWAVKYSLKSGVLSEQLNPFTGEQISVSPLTWSHAGFIITIIKYLEKLKNLKIIKKS
jgi:GH15 family glucan-1,4-alpha-glucosidase